MEEMKQCPNCAESIKSQAIVCRYCHTNIAKDQEGRFVKVCLRARDKTYYGEIFLPAHTSRLSTVINDQRQFIALTHTREDTETTEIEIGFLAINKNAVEWIRLLEEDSTTSPKGQI